MRCRNLAARVVMVTFLVGHALCEMEQSTKTETTTLAQELIETYNSNFETAKAMERSEKVTTKNVTDEFRVNLVKNMADFRLEMIVHRNFSFGQDSNEKWLYCVNANMQQINRMEEVYSQAEGDCVSNAQGEIAIKKQALKQIMKEIRDWKRGYKYLQNLCKEKYVLTKKNTDDCLIVYMQEDNYNATIERLLELMETSQTDLKIQARESLANFDDCLRSIFSNYLSGLRTLRKVLNKCYKRTNVVDSSTSNNVGCISLFKLNCVPV